MLARWCASEPRGMGCYWTRPPSRPHFDTESFTFPRARLRAKLPCTLTPRRRFSAVLNCEESKSESSTDYQKWAAVKMKLKSIVSNSHKVSRSFSRIGHTLGIDLGDSRTGVAVSLTGYGPRPLNVLRLKGEKLIDELVQIAAKERADEFVLGLPISHDGKETLQSSKVRSFAGRLATQAAQRGWRVYLVDEFGSSQEGLDHMLELGVKQRARRQMSDSYAAVAVLQSYFGDDGGQAHLVVPKGLENQENLCLGARHGLAHTDEDYESG